MDTDLQGEEELHPYKMQGVAELVLLQAPPEAESEKASGEPPKRDSDVNEVFRSSPNPVVAADFGSTEEVQRSAVPPRMSSHEILVSELEGRDT